MQFLAGLAMVVAGFFIAAYGRPEAGGRLAAFIAQPGMGTTAALVLTALIGLGLAFAIAGIIEMAGGV